MPSFATDKVMELLLVTDWLIAMENTNHWMRGGLMDGKLPERDMYFMGWTNTEANMPHGVQKIFVLEIIPWC